METLKRLIPLVCAAAILLGVYWWQGHREEAPGETTGYTGLDASTSSVPTEPPTTEPTTEPVPPTTQPVTLPTDVPVDTPPTETEPTEPTEPPLTAERCLLEPEYPSYEELFSGDVSYADYGYNWVTVEGETFRVLHLDTMSGDVRITDSGYENEYVVPNTGAFVKQYSNPLSVGCDGRYAYFCNSSTYNGSDPNRIFRLDLETGAVEMLVEDVRIYGWPSLRANCVLYYVRGTEQGAEICRMYVPDRRVDVLYALEKPEFVFDFFYPSTSQGQIGWEGINSRILERAIEEWEDPDSSYKIWAPDKDKNPNAQTFDYSELWNWWNREDRAESVYFRDGLEFFFHFFQEDTGIWGLEKVQIDPTTGKTTRKEGTLDNCFLGSGASHDHFDPVYEPLPVPRAILSDWKPAPGWDAREACPEVEAGEYPYATTLRIPGRDSTQVFWIDGSDVSLVKDAPWHVVGYSRQAVYCLTEENVLMELSADGSVCNALYAAGGEVSNVKYANDMLLFREGSRILLLDIRNGQYRGLLDDPEAWIEMWTGETKFCFGMSKGLYYQQYLFDINTGLIEETFIL